MNEATPPPAPQPPTAQRRATDSAPARFGRRRALLTLIGVGLALAVAYAVLESRREARVQGELAEARAREVAEATARAEAATQQVQEAQKKLAELEQAAADTAATAEPPAPGRDDVVLFEVERLVTLAMHDLQLARQPATALAALELADARLAVGNSPRWAALRRALARDIERLRAVPAVDTVGIALKLDQLIAGADVWPMVSSPVPPPPPPKAPPRAAPKKAEPLPELPPPPPPPGAWQRLRTWISAEFGDLVRINEVATPEALLLSAEQEKLVRQQLKLRLLGARVALLARNDRLYHSDIENAQTLLALYFEGRVVAVANAAATLRQLNTIALAFDVPTLADSQAAVRAARARRP
jgi:uroporphyrin-III C-methyltransferase